MWFIGCFKVRFYALLSSFLSALNMFSPAVYDGPLAAKFCERFVLGCKFYLKVGQFYSPWNKYNYFIKIERCTETYNYPNKVYFIC